MINRRTCLAAISLLVLTACDGAAGSDEALDLGGPFTLVETTGETVTEAELEGKWSLIYFGFAYCPDICPSTLAVMNQALDELGPRGEDVQTILISVDPERDTPEALGQYIALEGFPEGLRGFTGSPRQVAEAASAYRIYYEKSSDAPDYTVNHQSLIYLTNPDGEVVRVMGTPMSPAEIATQLRDAMG